MSCSFFFGKILEICSSFKIQCIYTPLTYMLAITDSAPSVVVIGFFCST